MVHKRKTTTKPLTLIAWKPFFAVEEECVQMVEYMTLNYGGEPPVVPLTEAPRLIHIYFKWVPSVGVGWMSDGNTHS